MGRKNINQASKAKDELSAEDIAYHEIADIMQSDVSRMWTSVEIYKLYKQAGGVITRETLVKKIADTFGSKLLVLSSPSIASILVFRNHASSIMRIENVDDDNVDIEKIAKVVINEIDSIPLKRDTYNKHIDIVTAKQDVSPTLMQLLKTISKNFANDSLAAILIGNIITSRVSNRTTVRTYL